MSPCPKCRTECAGPFCASCGTKVHERCGACKGLVGIASKFCCHCGKPMGGGGAPKATPAAAPKAASPASAPKAASPAAAPKAAAPARRGGFAGAPRARGGGGGVRRGGAAPQWGARKPPATVSMDTVKRVDALGLDSASGASPSFTIEAKKKKARAAPAASSTSSSPAPAPAATTPAAAPAAPTVTVQAEQQAPKAAPKVASASTPVVSSTPAVSSASTATLSAPNKKKKRHSKILLDNDTNEATAALDVEGLVQKKPKKGGIGNMWAQRMQEQQNEAFQKNRDKLRTRRRGGVEFMDTQIRNLITEMKRLNTGAGSGIASVPYGVLFSQTQDTMPALSATLTCAKKRGVVAYEGGMLMQGQSDNIVINLIKDQIEDSADFKSVFGTGPIKMEEKPRGPEKCHFCNKTVYPSERVAANGKTMHKHCFRCCECNTVLKLAAFAYNGGKFYCETHFQQMFKKGSGYNF